MKHLLRLSLALCLLAAFVPAAQAATKRPTAAQMDKAVSLVNDRILQDAREGVFKKPVTGYLHISSLANPRIRDWTVKTALSGALNCKWRFRALRYGSNPRHVLTFRPTQQPRSRRCWPYPEITVDLKSGLAVYPLPRPEAVASTASAVTRMTLDRAKESAHRWQLFADQRFQEIGLRRDWKDYPVPGPIGRSYTTSMRVNLTGGQKTRWVKCRYTITMTGLSSPPGKLLVRITSRTSRNCPKVSKLVTDLRQEG